MGGSAKEISIGDGESNRESNETATNNIRNKETTTQSNSSYGNELVDEGNQVPLIHEDATSAQEIDKVNRNNSARSIDNEEKEEDNGNSNNKILITTQKI